MFKHLDDFISQYCRSCNLSRQYVSTELNKMFQVFKKNDYINHDKKKVS